MEARQAHSRGPALSPLPRRRPEQLLHTFSQDRAAVQCLMPSPALPPSSGMGVATISAARSMKWLLTLQHGELHTTVVRLSLNIVLGGGGWVGKQSMDVRMGTNRWPGCNAVVHIEHESIARGNNIHAVRPNRSGFSQRM